MEKMKFLTEMIGFPRFPCLTYIGDREAWLASQSSRLLSHSSRLLSRYRVESPKIEKFTPRRAQNTKNHQKRSNNGGER